MQLIQNNPYRIAGILSNASERELQKQKTKIKAFSKVGKDIKSDFDFQVLGNIDRTEDSVNKAFSNIEQNQDKVNFALFWFLNASPFDNTAIEYLKNGNEEKALEIWEKVTTNKDVNSKNFSAFNNLGTYKLLSSHKSDIKTGIEAKIKLIESDSFQSFVHSVADTTYTIDSQKLSEKLIDELLTQFKNQYSSLETLQLFSGCNGTTQKYLTQKFTEEPIYKIENQIENCKNRRRQNPKGAYDIGLKLFIDSKQDLILLKSLIKTNDLKYKTIADKLANEIMQCGIDYFKEWKDQKDPSKEGLNLLKHAKSIAVGRQTQDRIEENNNGIKEWSETAPIKEDLAFITNKLEVFQNVEDSILHASHLVKVCKPKLHNISSALGVNDDFYLDISSAVVNNALGMIIDVVNDAQRELEPNRINLINLRNVADKAVYAIINMSTLDMNSQTRQRYDENKSTIISINNQLDNLTRQNHSTKSTSSTRTTSTYQQTSSEPSNLAKILCYGIPMVIGTFIVPVIGTVIGYFIGNWIYKNI